MKALTSFEETIGKTIIGVSEHCGTRCIKFEDSYIVFYPRHMWDDLIIGINAAPDMDDKDAHGLVSKEEWQNWYAGEVEANDKARREAEIAQYKRLKAKYE